MFCVFEPNTGRCGQGLQLGASQLNLVGGVYAVSKADWRLEAGVNLMLSLIPLCGNGTGISAAGIPRRACHVSTE